MRGRRIHSYDSVALFGGIVLACFLEAASLIAMFQTMGHAGPEGGFAIAGWLGLLMNFPGLGVVGLTGWLGGDHSVLTISAVLFAIQVPFLAYFFFVAIRVFRIISGGV
jgi:hypothetical protein